ncbi:hypothetical protein X777_02589 [Ooceraea biroi]|uniref:Uncharacterized protein n=1 Tax=Ooceraea biroi TaxID=2015173 RepID=A0A026WN13_OOCBI|nr:hypothetical protein X777_02589 [Ooceraea biroi]
MLSICSSTSFIDILPRKMAATVSTILLTSSGCERREAGHEEMQTRERHHVHRELPQVGIHCHAGHGSGDQMIEVAIGRGSQFQRTEANIVERFVVDAICLVRVFHQLMD